jgi:hypothetical protein
MARQGTRRLIRYGYATRSSACKVDSHAQIIQSNPLGAANLYYDASNLWTHKWTRNSRFRMLPTLQSVFLDRTEGPLGLRLLQLQVISKRQEKSTKDCWEGTRKGGEILHLKCAAVGQRIACHRQVQHIRGGMQ